LQLVLGEADILILGDLEAADELLAGRHYSAGRTVCSQADSAPAPVVKEVEGDCLGARRRVETNRNGDEANGEASGQDSARRHGGALSVPRDGSVAGTRQLPRSTESRPRPRRRMQVHDADSAPRIRAS